jgi:hypothetical protein
MKDVPLRPNLNNGNGYIYANDNNSIWAIPREQQNHKSINMREELPNRSNKKNNLHTLSKSQEIDIKNDILGGNWDSLKKRITTRLDLPVSDGYREFR